MLVVTDYFNIVQLDSKALVQFHVKSAQLIPPVLKIYNRNTWK
jgi:hypothetical protein